MSLARAYGRYGYRRITALLQPKRRRQRLADESCIRLRPERANHVWAYDFVEDRTPDGRKYRMLNIVDEYTRECLAIKVARKLNSMDVIETLADLFLLRGVPSPWWVMTGRSRLVRMQCLCSHTRDR